MKVLLLAGGESSERDVSMASGESVYKALKRLGHDVLVMDPLSGRSMLEAEPLFISHVKTGETGPIPTRSITMSLTDVLHRPDFPNIECVFIALHGGAGENGSIQALLQLAGVPFIGSKMTASAVAMDKAISKRLFQSVGIKTPEYRLYRLQDEFVPYGVVREIAETMPLPLIVKPNDSGSTVGLTKVDNVEDLHPAIVTAAEESRNILIEEYIKGREMTVAVLNGKPLPVVEIIPKSGLYDYEAKYTKGMTSYMAPAEIDSEIAERLQDAACKAYEVIGATGLARVDFILQENRDFYCLELNTLPGMTDLSLAPMAARAAGIEFDRLIQMLLDAAVGKKED
ncbi:MAG TPA: D-alanine--D-alanine ligase [candidate division Zixibacteria bacterium]|nr:D-alanine--D-alanine ligase [candidate division Zixibacteria bacterium]